MDFTELQVKGHNLAGTREAVAGEVVKMVATEIKELGFGMESPWDFGMTATFTRGMVGFNLRKIIIIYVYF